MEIIRDKDILQWYTLLDWCDKSRKDQGDIFTKIASNGDQNITHPSYPMHIMLTMRRLNDRV